MKRLCDYPILKKDVFYRGIPILEYISEKTLTNLDIEAIKATIMDSLVYKGLIDPYTQYLDFNNLCIVDSKIEDVYEYNPTPDVCGIPLWIKEKARRYCPVIAGSVPVAVALAKPSSKTVHYCVYDVNTSLSILFDDFAFLTSDYDSPTRNGIRVKDRPFLEAMINDVSYLFDILTKRIFKKDEFIRRYNMKIQNIIYKSDFDKKKQKYYEDSIKQNVQGFSSFLAMSMPLFESFKDIEGWQEYLYEIEKGKELYPDSFMEAIKMNEECDAFFKEKRYILK